MLLKRSIQGPALMPQRDGCSTAKINIRLTEVGRSWFKICHESSRSIVESEWQLHNARWCLSPWPWTVESNSSTSRGVFFHGHDE